MQCKPLSELLNTLEQELYCLVYTEYATIQLARKS